MKYVDSVSGVWVGMFIRINSYMSSRDMLIGDIITHLKTSDKALVWLCDCVGTLLTTSYNEPIAAVISLNTENAQVNLLPAFSMCDLQPGVSRRLAWNDPEAS